MRPANLTTAKDLQDRIAELLARPVTLEACRSAMHALGWTRYEALTTEQVGMIADAVCRSARQRCCARLNSTAADAHCSRWAVGTSRYCRQHGGRPTPKKVTP